MRGENWTNSAYTLKYAYVVVTLIFLFAFPKGGIKENSLPITWGYLLLFLPCPFYLFSIAKNRISSVRLLTYCLTLPFSVWSVLILSLSDNSNLSLVRFSSFIISFIFMPFISLIVFGNILDKLWFQSILKTTFKICIRFVIVFGLFHFFYKLITGIYFEIPFLTVNADDYGMTHTKMNLRNDYVSKLLSTYTNGNIFGISMLIVSPLYLRIEKQRIFVILFGMALLLTLSRTVWIGSLFLLFLYFIKSLRKHPILLFIPFVVIPIISYVISSFVIIFELPYDFLFDEELGGRISQLSVLSSPSLVGNLNPDLMGEIVYLSVLRNFGIIGLLLFFLYILSPLIACKYFKKRNDLQKGIMVYLLLCAIDGAILLIPVMCFFWFISALALSDKESEIIIL
jgi:hypothetical protein